MIILTCEERFLTTQQSSTDIYAVLRYSALTADSGVFTYLDNHVTGCDVNGVWFNLNYF